MKQLRGTDLKKFKKDIAKHTKKIIVILENIQYANNVASIFRTCDAAKVEKIILTGISQKPPFGKELRKTSRNKERSVTWEYHENIGKILQKYKALSYQIVGVEITDNSIDYKTFSFSDKICLIFGNETYGITKKTLERLEHTVYIPMYGKGSSLNVSVSCAIALFRIV